MGNAIKSNKTIFVFCEKPEDSQLQINQMLSTQEFIVTKFDFFYDILGMGVPLRYQVDFRQTKLNIAATSTILRSLWNSCQKIFSYYEITFENG